MSWPNATFGVVNMQKLLDPTALITADHFESIQNDLLSREFSRCAPEPAEHADELASLREFNGKLLERIGEFRKQNLALSTNESTIRASLTTQEKRCADLERKLAKLTDEKWEKTLEVEALSKLEGEQRDEIERIKQESAQALEQADRQHLQAIESIRAENSDLRNRLDAAVSENARLAERLAASERLNSERAARIDEADQLLSGFEEALEQSKQELQTSKDAATRALSAAHELQAQLNGKIQALTAREAQLITAFESLRAEYSSIDACYKEASATVVRLRGEFEVQSRMLADAQKDVESLTFERTRLQQLLEVKEARDEGERTRLQTTREQLDFLERHLRQVSEALKKDKFEVLRISKQIADELQLTRQHPFREYLEAAEMELSHLQTQMQSMSEMSPSRAKLEARIARATEHRDVLKSALFNSERHLEERLQVVQTIIRNASV